MADVAEKTAGYYAPEKEVPPSPVHTNDGPVDGELVNASGHRQELERNFSLLSICAVAVTTGNTWIAQGGSVTTALYNGGLAGTIYELYACPRQPPPTPGSINLTPI